MISVIVIAKNEEARIKVCLESVSWADEIILADNGSTDKTLEIAQKYTSKIVKYNGDDFAELRNTALKEASGDWILCVDADERILESLSDEILGLVQSEKYNAYAISRRNIIFGTEQKYGPFWPDWVIRLIKRSALKEWRGKVHESPVFDGALGYTKNSLLHLTHRNVDHIVLKSLEWSKIDAKLRLEAGHPKMTGWRFLRILITETFNQGVVRKGFFSGTIGVMDSLMQTFSLIITYIRLWELQQSTSMDEKYKKIDETLIQDDFKI